ncbi:MAG: MOSC domain-containing protein [Bacteriovorax sp.]|jgi:MOSC domain-containing protein YiiM
MSKYKILGIFTGQIARLSNNVESAITKHPETVLKIKKHAIEHDNIANKKFHGGDMRVVHHYSLKNYNFLKEKFPEIADRFVPGSFGENILTEELTEAELNIGDIYSLGSAKIQLTVPRRPCATINYAYNDDRILKVVMEAGRTGWFYRVLEEGEVRVGDYLELIDQPFPGLPVSKLFEQGYGRNRFSDIDFLKKCFHTGLMDKGWKPKIEEALTHIQ